MKRLFLCLIILLLVPVTTRGQSTNRAGLVLLGSDGNVQTYCVAFAEDTISGVELLQRAQLPLITQPAGNDAAVCKIGNDGCDFPAEACFCRSGGGQRSEYWAFWQLNGAAWEYGQRGAGATRVQNGDVYGWAWGAGESGSGLQPPVRTFAQICEQGTGTPPPKVPVPGEQSTPEAFVPSTASEGAQATEQVSAQPSNLPTLQSAPPASQPPTPNPQPLNYGVFGALLFVVIGMIVLVLRRGAR